MKRHALAFIAIFMLCAFPAQAQQVVAVADADYLMNASEAAKSIKQQLKSQTDKFQQEFNTTKAILQKEEKGLIEKRQNLTEAEFSKQVKAFQQKMGDEDKKFKRKKAKLDEAFADALQTLQKEIGLIIQEVAREKGISYVLAKQDILFAAAGQPDITQDVLKRLNDKKKTIDINIK